MLNLDRPEDFRRVDLDGMLDRIDELPRQCLDAWQLALTISFPSNYTGVDNIVVLGMGGSAIGSDLARTLVIDELKVPFQIVRDYDLPAFVGQNSLVIASSYSGNTEETLMAFDQAIARNCKVMAITTAGQIKSKTEQKALPLLVFDYKAQPRAALGFSFVLLLGVLHKLGLISDKEADLREAVQVMEDSKRQLGPSVPSANNPAKRLAQQLHGRLPVVYGGGILSEVARRWKGQVNENAKAWSFFEVMPELNHNASVGYEFPREVCEKITVIFLDSSHLHPRVRLRYKVTQDILSKRGVRFEVVEASGGSRLAQMMHSIYFGDYVSYYLSMLYEIDPSPVDIINYLKGELAKA
jgi:glucose/mannose-6-phosphate isomerase